MEVKFHSFLSTSFIRRFARAFDSHENRLPDAFSDINFRPHNCDQSLSPRWLKIDVVETRRHRSCQMQMHRHNLKIVNCIANQCEMK